MAHHHHGQINRLRLSEAVECQVNNAFVSDWQFDPTEPVKSDGAGIVFDNAGYGTHFVFEATVSAQQIQLTFSIWHRVILNHT